MKITGAIFDMDGTLVDSLGFWDILWRGLGKMYLGDESFRPDIVTEKAVRTSTLYEAAAIIHRSCKIGESVDSLFSVLDGMLKSHYEKTVEMKDGAMEFLEYLHGHGIKMCIATATAPHLLCVLMDKFGLRKYFQRVFSCSEVGKGKDFPDVFLKAYEWLGADKETTYVFEDSVVAVETAVNAGFKTVGIYDKYGFNTERIEALSDFYIGTGDSLRSLITTPNF